MSASSAHVVSDERQAAFDRRYRLLELKERRADRELKRRELDISKAHGLSFTTGQATVAAAVIALLSGVAGGLIQGSVTRDVESGKNQALVDIEKLKAVANIELEKQKQTAAERLDRAKFETTLILKATEALKREDQIRNLKFFLNAGFIRDPDGKLAKMDEASYPSTPTASPKDSLSSFDDLQIRTPKISLTKLPENHRAVAQRIIEKFSAAGYSPAVQIAAVAVAMIESGLNPTIVSDGGNGFGLYSFHPGGLGRMRDNLLTVDGSIDVALLEAKVTKLERSTTVVDAVSQFVRRITRPRDADGVIVQTLSFARLLVEALD